MSYTFKTMTDAELNNLLPEGVYDFAVKTSARKLSQSGNPMAELNLTIWDENGKVSNIRDWLVFSSVPLNIRKVKHFCDAVGLVEAYKNGELPEDLETLSGSCLISIEEGKMIPDDKLHGKPKGSKYQDRNFVVDYIKSTEEEKKNNNYTLSRPPLSESTSVPNGDLPFDDIIPF